MTMLRSTRSTRVHALSTPRTVSTVTLVTAGVLASALMASVAYAAPIDRTLFSWTGRVDREIQITMRGRDVRVSGIDAGAPNRARVNDALPRGRGDVIVRLNDGRGDVDVLEQPSARNGYTTRIRIRDRQGGADTYRITAYWNGDDRFDDRTDNRNDRNDDRYDDRRGNNGNGGGWGSGGRRDGEPFPGRGNGNGRDNRDRNDRGGWDDRSDRNGRNDNGMLRWSGRVDDVVEIRISGRRVDAITRSGARVDNVNANIRGDGLPSRAVNLSIDRHAGRGSIQVVQQPSAWNGYTAIIRIHDPSGGASFYDFSASW